MNLPGDEISDQVNQNSKLNHSCNVKEQKYIAQDTGSFHKLDATLPTSSIAFLQKGAKKQ